MLENYFVKLQDTNFSEFQREETDLSESKVRCATSKASHNNRAERSSDYGFDARQEIFVPLYDSRIN